MIGRLDTAVQPMRGTAGERHAVAVHMCPNNALPHINQYIYTRLCAHLSNIFYRFIVQNNIFIYENIQTILSIYAFRLFIIYTNIFICI